MREAATAVTMLGAFELRSHGVPITLPRSVERVVAFLALHHGPASRQYIAGSLWLDVPEDRAMANLRSALWRLRRPGVSVIEARGEQLDLVPDVVVDVRELSEAARRLLDGSSGDDPREVERLATCRDLLGDWYEDWVLVEREHFRQIRLHALERLTGRLTDDGQYGRAAQAALAAIASEPLRESAHRALIAVHLAQGNRSEAIRQFGIYRRLLGDELGLEPSRHMTTLIGDVPASTIERVMRHERDGR